MDEDQTREEIEAHFAAGGAPDTCFRFLDSLFVMKSYDVGWQMMDANQRLCRAQAWLWNNRTFPDIAGRLDELASWLVDGPHPGELLWDQFSEIELRGAVEAWGHLYKRSLGAGSRPRPIAVDLELVILVPTDGKDFRVDAPTLVEDALTWLVRRTDGGNRIAAWTDRVPLPGWPPDLHPDAGQHL